MTAAVPEQQVRSIARDELAALGITVERRHQLTEHAQELRHLVGDFELTHDGHPHHSLPRDVVETAVERFVGPQVVGDHAAEHRRGGPPVGDVEVFPTAFTHDSSPSLVVDTGSVGERSGPAGDVDPDRTPSCAVAAPDARTVCQFTGKFAADLRAANDRLEELARRQAAAPRGVTQ